MKHINWKVLTGLVLIAFSGLFYFIHYAIFRDSHHIFLYLIGDIAFLPIEVLLVTLIIEHLLNEREKQALLKKMNMLIGAFYSEAGMKLMKYCSGYSSDLLEIRNRMLITVKWTDKDFSNAMEFVRSSDPKIDSRKGDLRMMRDFLQEKRDFLLGLLANPNLLEHDAFTDLLWAVFHLAEELSVRNTLEGLPRTDYDHLSGDMKRAYAQLLSEWLAYMKHLKSDYPYLFSLAIRMNPMDADADPVVK